MVSFKQHRQFLVYCAIGATAASLDFLIYSSLLMATGVHHQIANAVGYTAGTLLSFVMNARFNFKTRDWPLLRLLSFCAVGLLGLSTSAATLYLLVDRLGMDRHIAKLLTIIMVVFVQYNLNRLVSFRKSPPAANG